MDAGNNEQIPAAARTCAVCRHLARECNATCILGPYFPLSRTEEFYWVYEVFGIANLTDIVSSVEVNDRATTVETLIFEARMRLHDLVHGSLGLEKKLRADVINAQNELNAVNHLLRLHRGDQEAGPSNSVLKGKKSCEGRFKKM